MNAACASVKLLVSYVYFESRKMVRGMVAEYWNFYGYLRQVNFQIFSVLFNNAIFFVETCHDLLNRLFNQTRGYNLTRYTMWGPFLNSYAHHSYIRITILEISIKSGNAATLKSCCLLVHLVLLYIQYEKMFKFVVLWFEWITPEKVHLMYYSLNTFV